MQKFSPRPNYHNNKIRLTQKKVNKKSISSDME